MLTLSGQQLSVLHGCFLHPGAKSCFWTYQRAPQTDAIPSACSGNHHRHWYSKSNVAARGAPREFVVHLILHTAFLSGCDIYLVLWIICIACSFEDVAWLLARQITPDTLGFLAFIVIATPIYIFCAAVCIFLMWKTLWHTFLPSLLHYHNGI